MQITKDILQKFCPSCSMPSDKIVEMTATFAEQARRKAENICGEALFAELDRLDFPLEGRRGWLLEVIARVICLEAYCKAIPSLDLVLTPTGFGVVSNQNLAPASADRVQRLLNAVEAERDAAIDALLISLRSEEQWLQSERSHRWIHSLFWLGSHMRFFGIDNPTRADIADHISDIQAGENELSRFISIDMLCSVIDNDRTNGDSCLRLRLADMCRSFVAMLAQGDRYRIDRQRLLIISFCDRNKASLTEYAASSVCEANSFSHYQNQRDDSCFFFG